MMRIRLLSAFLACFAVATMGLPALAFVAADMHSDRTMSIAAVSAFPSHCEDCSDCGASHCPQSVHCTAPCVTAIPTHGAVFVGLQRIGSHGRMPWSLSAALDGEDPVPEPLPPRT